MCIDPDLILSEFRNECAKDLANVRWNKFVSENARILFDLKTPTDILRYIAGNAIEPLVLLEIEPYRESGPNQGELVYSYSFKTASRIGYLAFYKAKTGTWIIKSLHEPKLPLNRDILNITMKNIEHKKKNSHQHLEDK